MASRPPPPAAAPSTLARLSSGFTTYFNGMAINHAAKAEKEDEEPRVEDLPVYTECPLYSTNTCNMCGEPHNNNGTLPFPVRSVDGALCRPLWFRDEWVCASCFPKVLAESMRLLSGLQSRTPTSRCVKCHSLQHQNVMVRINNKDYCHSCDPFVERLDVAFYLSGIGHYYRHDGVGGEGGGEEAEEEESEGEARGGETTLSPTKRAELEADLAVIAKHYNVRIQYCPTGFTGE